MLFRTLTHHHWVCKTWIWTELERIDVVRILDIGNNDAEKVCFKLKNLERTVVRTKGKFDEKI